MFRLRMRDQIDFVLAAVVHALAAAGLAVGRIAALRHAPAVAGARAWAFPEESSSTTRDDESYRFPLPIL